LATGWQLGACIVGQPQYGPATDFAHSRFKADQGRIGCHPCTCLLSHYAIPGCGSGCPRDRERSSRDVVADLEAKSVAIEGVRVDVREEACVNGDLHGGPCSVRLRAGASRFILPVDPVAHAAQPRELAQVPPQQICWSRAGSCHVTPELVASRVVFSGHDDNHSTPLQELVLRARGLVPRHA
jgi:hypothetical protein